MLTRYINECISVLAAAALGLKAPVVTYLLNDAQAQPNWQNKIGRTALHYAFHTFDVYYHPCTPPLKQTVDALLDGGADPTIKFGYGSALNYTVLHFASYHGNRCDFRLSCDDVGCYTDFCTYSQASTPCPSDINSYGDGLQFFGAAQTLMYLVERGGDPTAVRGDGANVIQGVPIPDNPSKEEWGSGYCKATYEYLKSLESSPMAESPTSSV